MPINGCSVRKVGFQSDSVLLSDKKESNSQIACLFFSFVFFTQKRSLYKDTYVAEMYRAERITSNLSICNLGFSITGEFVLNKHFFSFQPKMHTTPIKTNHSRAFIETVAANFTGLPTLF